MASACGLILVSVVTSLNYLAIFAEGESKFMILRLIVHSHSFLAR